MNSSEHSSEHGASLLAVGSNSRSVTTALRAAVGMTARRCCSRDVQYTHDKMRSKPKMTAIAADVKDTVFFFRLKTPRMAEDVTERCAGAQAQIKGLSVSESVALLAMLKLGSEVLSAASETVLGGSFGSASAALQGSAGGRSARA